MQYVTNINVEELAPAQFLSTPILIHAGTKSKVDPIAIKAPKNPAANPAMKKYHTFL